MDSHLLTQGRILVVKNPRMLPPAVDHSSAISALCRDAALVLLFSYGDEQYLLPKDYRLPMNAKLIRYDYETLDSSVSELRDVFQAFGAGFYTRHLTEDPLPFILTGAIIALPEGASLEFYNKASMETDLEKVELDETDSSWSIDD